MHGTKLDVKRPAPRTACEAAVRESIAPFIERARNAQRAVAAYSQREADLVALGAAWSILEPERNRSLAQLAVADTGLGNVADKMQKNHRKTLGLLRDISGARTVGVVREDTEIGITEIARPVGVVAAIVPSTNPAATPANKAINALKCLNAIVFAPSPKGWRTCALLVEYIRAELVKLDAPPDLVQVLPAPISREATTALMEQADLVIATGSQANVRAAYSSGTPALGVGLGNAAVIIDASADLADAAEKIGRSKAFDNATSCSAENSVVLLTSRYDEAVAALEMAGGIFLNSEEKRRLQEVLWIGGKLNPDLIARDAPTLLRRAGLRAAEAGAARFIMVEENGFGPQFPYSGEKLSPVLSVYRAQDFAHACRIVERIYAHQGAGHSVGLHTQRPDQARVLAAELPVARVIVNQAHGLATGGSFDNGLPFSLSMGCGTWGGNGFSDNLHWRHYMNVTRIAQPIPERVPDLYALLEPFFAATQALRQSGCRRT